MNLVILNGTVCQKPESKPLDGGKQVCKVRVKTVEHYQGKSFDSYHSVSAFGDTAEQMASFSEGDPCLVMGKLKTRSYEKDGEKRYITEVQASKFEGTASKEQRPALPSDEPNLDDIPF